MKRMSTKLINVTSIIIEKEILLKLMLKDLQANSVYNHSGEKNFLTPLFK